MEFVPIYDNEGLSVLDGSEQAVTDDNSWKTIGNGIDMSNSMFNPNDNCLIGRAHSQGQQFGPSGIRFWDTGGIPPQAVAYNQGQEPSMSIPQGLTSNGTTEMGPYGLKYFKTFIQGNSADIVSFDHGMSAPEGTLVSDVNNTGFGNWQPGADGFSNEDEYIFGYFYYDRKDFYNAVANGGFDYTPPTP